MALDTVEQLVNFRLPFLTPAEDNLVTSYKKEVYYELSPYFDIEQTEVAIEDDANYTGVKKSIVADIVACYMLYWKSQVESLGEWGKIVYTEFVGSGANVVALSGLYSGEDPVIFTITVESIGIFFSFTWQKGTEAPVTGVEITPGVPQLLSDGVYVTFSTTAGLVVGDIWLSRAVPTVDNTTGFLKKGKAGPAEVEFEQYKAGSANQGARLTMSMEALLTRMKQQANRKAHSLDLVIDICGDCIIAITRIMDQTSCPPFVVAKLGWCNEDPVD